MNDYQDVGQTADRWAVSERSVRYYCQSGRVPGAVLDGKTWRIPADAPKPVRKKRAGALPRELLPRLRAEQEAGLSGGIYHRIQIELTYNSNHIEGSRLSHEQTRYIFETNTISAEQSAVHVDDVVETANHFRCIDLIIDQANYPLSEAFIKQLHFVLKTGTSDSRKPWFAVGGYKRFENEVGGEPTTNPADVASAMKRLLADYRMVKTKSLQEIIAFHYAFERIHPFQDGNGRVGRLILFKECLRNRIVPFIIEDGWKAYYYRGLREWRREPGYLMDTCLFAQDRFKAVLDYFGILYDG